MQAKVINKLQRNGRVYVTWAVVVSVLIGVIAFLANRAVNEIDIKMDRIDTSQRDMRERLRVLEELMRNHLMRRP